MPRRSRPSAGVHLSAVVDKPLWEALRQHAAASPTGGNPNLSASVRALLRQALAATPPVALPASEPPSDVHLSATVDRTLWTALHQRAKALSPDAPNVSKTVRALLRHALTP